jgi:thioredoxin reductase (NADPH)
MAGIAKKVYLIYRKDKLRCEEKLIKELEKINNIEVLYNTIPTKIIGKDSLESIDIITSGKENNLKLDGMFLSVGMDAETKIADNLITKNDQNYILSKECFTNKEGIFVAGDAREKEIRQLTTATADGTIAATNVINYLKTLN